MQVYIKKNLPFLLFGFLIIILAIIFSNYTLKSFFHMWVSHGIFPAVEFLDKYGTISYFKEYFFEHAWSGHNEKFNPSRNWMIVLSIYFFRDNYFLWQLSIISYFISFLLINFVIFKKYINNTVSFLLTLLLFFLPFNAELFTTIARSETWAILFTSLALLLLHYKNQKKASLFALISLSLAALQKETLILLLFLQVFIIFINFKNYSIFEKLISLIILSYSLFAFYKIFIIALTFSDGVYSRSINPLILINNFLKFNIIIFTALYILMMSLNYLFLLKENDKKKLYNFVILSLIASLNVFFQIIAYRDIPPLAMRYGSFFNILLFYQFFYFIYTIANNLKIRTYKNILVSLVIIFLYFDNYNWLKRNYKIQKRHYEKSMIFKNELLDLKRFSEENKISNYLISVEDYNYPYEGIFSSKKFIDHYVNINKKKFYLRIIDNEKKDIKKFNKSRLNNFASIRNLSKKGSNKRGFISINKYEHDENNCVEIVFKNKSKFNKKCKNYFEFLFF
tara:strand:+ start:3446 stop:4972 length:1527 start_codon:yes stop_codon:yes gene_type:complete